MYYPRWLSYYFILCWEKEEWGFISDGKINIMLSFLKRQSMVRPLVRAVRKKKRKVRNIFQDIYDPADNFKMDKFFLCHST